MVLEIWLIQGGSFFKARCVAKLLNALLKKVDSSRSKSRVLTGNPSLRSNSSENTPFQSHCTPPIAFQGDKSMHAQPRARTCGLGVSVHVVLYVLCARMRGG